VADRAGGIKDWRVQQLFSQKDKKSKSNNNIRTPASERKKK
jgi:hypothetical protein